MIVLNSELLLCNAFSVEVGVKLASFLISLWTCVGVFLTALCAVALLVIALLTGCLQEVRTLYTKLAPYQFFTAFSQLVSRISHPNLQVAELLEVKKGLVSFYV